MVGGPLLNWVFLRSITFKMLLLLNPEDFRSEFFPRWLKQWRWSSSPASEENGTLGDLVGTSAQALENSGETIRPFTGGTPCVGEVRLLAPELTPSSSLPVYVLLLQEWAPGWKLVAPFSRFTVPAVPGEFLIQDSLNNPDATGVLSTLCLWNAVSVPDGALQNSWLVETWEPTAYAGALSVFDSLQTGEPLSSELEFRTGVALNRQRSDPRNQYLREEAPLLSVLIRHAFAEAPKAGVRPVLPIHQVPLFGADAARASEGSTTIAFAADDSQRTGWTLRFGLTGRGEQILLTSEDEGRTVLVYVLGSDGEPCENLDGCWLEGSKSTKPIEIQQGHATLDCKDFGDSFGLRHRDGLSIPIFIKL